MICNKEPYICSGGVQTFEKRVSLSTTDIGSSFSQTADLKGTFQTLFGLDITADKIVNMQVYDANLTPAAIMLVGTYGNGVYFAASQACTLTGSLNVKVTYTS